MSKTIEHINQKENPHFTIQSLLVLIFYLLSSWSHAASFSIGSWLALGALRAVLSSGSQYSNLTLDAKETDVTNVVFFTTLTLSAAANICVFF